ncbi:glycoside hydrolase family 9 protein [Amycolatopsis sp. NBC_00355]|uniref:glycoside hydrolase family 9 protein n=1 Tax=Amycolatopsis sp. NBC_00355 TaxID=2975957 RepID=UPI002E264453
MRVDQVGYALGEAKHAYLLGGAQGTFTVVDDHGRTVRQGRIGPVSARGMTATKPFSTSTCPLWTYRVTAAGATSPPFRIDTARRLDRKPSHLADCRGTVYAEPKFAGEGGDEIVEPLTPLGGRVDVEGGWVDAGDFVKFTSNGVLPGRAGFRAARRPGPSAGEGGTPLSPNLAGRVAAAFALGAQARTSDVGELVTAFPHAYYPESSWEGDLELGATQLALAARELDDPRATGWARDAAKWAKTYIAGDGKSTLNLYDTSALAHADLAGLLRTGVSGAALGVRELAADPRRQLDTGVERAGQSPFRTAVDVTDFDAAGKSFGFAATARLYQRVTGDPRYAAFGARQRDFTLGANAWGVSLVVGVGATFPRCPHHQAANLAGPSKVLYGAVVNGPNGADNFADLPFPAGAKECTRPDESFNGQGSRYADDPSSWPSNEPAIDFTSTALLAFSLAGTS